MSTPRKPNKYHMSCQGGRIDKQTLIMFKAENIWHPKSSTRMHKEIFEFSLSGKSEAGKLLVQLTLDCLSISGRYQPIPRQDEDNRQHTTMGWDSVPLQARRSSKPSREYLHSTRFRQVPSCCTCVLFRKSRTNRNNTMFVCTSKDQRHVSPDASSYYHVLADSTHKIITLFVAPT